MLIIDVGMDEPNSNTVVSRHADTFNHFFNFRRGQIHQDITLCVHALFHRVSHVARQQGFRQIQIQVVLLKAGFGAHLDNIAKARSRDQRRFRPAALDQRIGGKRCPMDDLIDIGGSNTCTGADLMQAIDDGVFRGAVRC